MDRNNRGIYDNALLGILSNEGQILPFLDVFFDFLYRRTDFFRIKTDTSQKMGFPPGVAKKFVQLAFQKYYNLTNEKLKREAALAQEGEIPPPAIETVEVETTAADDDEETEEETGPAGPNPEGNPEGKLRTATSTENGVDEKKKIGEAASEREGTTPHVSRNEKEKQSSAEKGEEQQTSTPKPPEAANEGQDSDYDPVQARFQSNPESYNGAIRDNYSWSQSIYDIDVRVKVGRDVSSRNQIKVDLTHTHLRVKVLNIVDGSWSVPIDDDFPWRVKLDDCIWTLVPEDHVLVNLEKCEERWWEQLLVSEPKINVRAIDPSKPFEDLDAESQAKIQELAFNNMQKQMGRKTPKQEKVENILKEAWDKEGSPFRGQPFDPDLVNISCDNL
ncbi:nudC domain-containing protein 3-like [Ornithodoros turicata]|uniref:nudC domain-containing protein 3-like n=1 Tax=Ornithodoros turicata TaxID=34597 RepID=UPI0031386F81